MSPKPQAITLPANDTLAFKVCSYFVREPFEELSTADIQLKFSEFPGKADELLQEVVAAGLLNATRTRSKVAGMHLVYKAGPNLEKAWESDRRAAPVLAAAMTATVADSKPVQPSGAKAKATAANGTPFKLTLDLVKVHADLPLPSKAAGKKPNQWDAVFLMRDIPGKAAVLPEAAFRGAVLACSLHKRQGKPGVFEVRRIDAETCGIWRLNDDGSVPKNLAQAA